MIVHNMDTLNTAVSMISDGPVRYSDRYAYVIVKSPEVLNKLLHSQLEREDIAVVVPLGQEKSLEDYFQSLQRIRRQRKVDELRNMKAWLVKHPEVLEAKTVEDALKACRKVRSNEESGV